MAHFATLDVNNIVLRVEVIADNDTSVDGVESESIGQVFMASLYGSGAYKQTSYNGNSRKQFAGVGFFYDSIRDEFVSPEPYPSWSLDAQNDWQPPIPKPEGNYYWDEPTLAWVEIV